MSTRFGERLRNVTVLAVFGDYNYVAGRALACQTTRQWRTRQLVQGAAYTACAVAVVSLAPIAALLGCPLFVVRKMAHTAWGVGAQMARDKGGAIDPMADFMAILALWAGVSLDRIKRAKEQTRQSRSAAFNATLRVATLPATSVGGVLLREFGAAVRQKMKSILSKRAFGIIPVGSLAVATAGSAGVALLLNQFGACAEQFYADKFAMQQEVGTSGTL